IAEEVYSRPGTVSRGTTTATAPQRLQRYRRASTTTSSGAPPGSAGPRCCRSRRPCPRTTTPPPTGQLAAPQPGQQRGRTASTDGTCCRQALTGTSLRTTCWELRPSTISEHD